MRAIASKKCDSSRLNFLFYIVLAGYICKKFVSAISTIPLPSVPAKIRRSVERVSSLFRYVPLYSGDIINVFISIRVNIANHFMVCLFCVVIYRNPLGFHRKNALPDEKIPCHLYIIHFIKQAIISKTSIKAPLQFPKTRAYRFLIDK